MTLTPKMTLSIIFLLAFVSIAGAQTKKQNIYFVKANYAFHIDTVKYSQIWWRDNRGFIHADSAIRLFAGMRPEKWFLEYDMRYKWLFLYDGTLIQEKDVLNWRQQ
jgi:hypothetical protein